MRIARAGRLRWFLTCGLLIGFLAASAGGARAGQADGLRAAFVLNFLKFVEWPASGPERGRETLLLTIVGDCPLAPELKASLDGKQVQGRKIEVRTYSEVADWKRAGLPGHALFVSPLASSVWPELRAAVAGRPVLTLSEMAGFCAQGGMINLSEQDDRLRFEANPAVAMKAGLRLSSQLLKLATIVTTNGEDGGRGGR